MSVRLQLLIAIITLIAALIGRQIVVKVDNESTSYSAPPPLSVEGLNGVNVDPNSRDLNAPPGSKIEGLDGLSID